jgi:DNA-binding transcriptional regulator YiaG
VTPERIKKIRTGAGLTQAGLAAMLRLQGATGKRTVRRWESGEQPITGPASLLLELIEAGELPRRYHPLSLIAAEIAAEFKLPTK